MRKAVQKKIPKAIPLSVFKNNSRPLSTILCYKGTWGAALYKTWGDFLEGTARLRQQINSVNSERWLLHCEDRWNFLLAFTALLQCKKEILLSANISPAYIAEIRNEGDRGGVCFLTDLVFSEGEIPENTFFISSLLQSIQTTDASDQRSVDQRSVDHRFVDQRSIEEGPPIYADETSILIYTSGSTGKPKAIQQRLTELENDSFFLFTQWGEELFKRKACTTVSQHHQYGLVFSILWPFSAGVPFRRTRIEFPEELEKLSDSEYMIVTVPAFLKRVVEEEKPAGFKLKSPWIFCAGGVLPPETARKTSEALGFWPMEIYGSTETAGIAWRQSVYGPEWTVFDNAEIRQNQDGCLVIRSPYIKDPAGFETADLVEILEDGRFLLKGRIDSIVKIEEKRISLSEVENRILQSGLAADACVLPFEDRRQYLVAAIVLNNKGKEKFSGLEKYEINTFWREYLLQYFENIVIPKKWRYPETLPADAQGKKKKEEIRLLFTGEKSSAETAGFISIDNKRIIAKTENSVSLEFSIPDTSPYFDGHFPGFPILPAVAQMEIVLRFASLYMGTDIDVSEIRRMKFSNLVRPFTPLVLSLEKNEGTLSFRISSPDGEIVYATGILKLMEKTDK